MPIKSITELLGGVASQIKDKSILVKFYEGTFDYFLIWIDGIEWRNYDFNIYEYFREEFGVEIPVTQTYDIMSADDDFILEHCFKNGTFSIATYDQINSALVNKSEEVVAAAISLGIDLETIDDAYIGHYKSFVEYVKERFNEENFEGCLVSAGYVQYINFDEMAEEREQGYLVTEGHIFDACR
ncbi:anti-restriction protein [Erwinia phage Faunus]|uniref:Antirestriction protein n=1 Tax=Erwinia phage Faunus TaxID=2182346 RepID=A0A2U8UWV6_9CAUD|nr:anti-restriction protein [Erwinia phage Faunus]AWN08604.1 hypothetical protein [Erwinia phage Faunus]